MLDAGPCEGDPDGGECDLLAEFLDKPSAYILTHARAIVTIQGIFLFDFVLDPNEIPLANCKFFPSETEKPIVTAHFQLAPNLQSDNSFSFWDDGESATWGLYDHDTGEEWSGSASGPAVVSLLKLDPDYGRTQVGCYGSALFCDCHGDVVPDCAGDEEQLDDLNDWSNTLPGAPGGVVGFVRWQGMATENFSSDKSVSEVQIFCLWQRLDTSLSSGSF